MKINLGLDLYLKGRIGWKGLAKKEYVDKSDYLIINGNALENGKINWSKAGFITEKRYNESPEIMLEEGDILITKDGTIGKIGYVKKLKCKATVASGIFVLRNIDKDNINFDYIYHYLCSDMFKNFIKRKKAIGSTINHLYQRDLSTLTIDLPNIKDQEKISKILNILNKKIDYNNAMISNLKSTINTIYSYWFLQFEFPNDESNSYLTSGGGMKYSPELNMSIPKDWKVKKLREINQVHKGMRKIYANEYLAKGDIPIIDQGRKFISGYINDDNVKINLNNCIIFGDVTKRIKYIHFPFAKGTDGSKLLDTSKVVPNCITYQQLILYKLPETGFARYYKFIKEKPILIPTKKISDKFANLTKIIYDEIFNFIKENSELEELKEFVLPLAMNGQITMK